MTIKSITLPDLCGSDTLGLTLKEERSLSLFGSGVVRKDGGA